LKWVYSISTIHIIIYLYSYGHICLRTMIQRIIMNAEILYFYLYWYNVKCSREKWKRTFDLYKSIEECYDWFVFLSFLQFLIWLCINSQCDACEWKWVRRTIFFAFQNCNNEAIFDQMFWWNHSTTFYFIMKYMHFV